MLNLIPLKQLALKLLPYLLLVLLLAGGWAYHKVQLSSSYDQGHSDGVAQQVRKQEQSDKLALQQHLDDKERLEREAKSQIDQARVDADFARASADRLREQIAAIKRIAENSTGPQPAGSSTSKTVSVLADLFQESLERNRSLAEFADASYNAGRACEASYDSLRRENVSLESGER